MSSATRSPRSPDRLAISRSAGPACGAAFANPKEYALFGTGSPPLGPTLDLPQYSNGAFVDMAEIIVSLTNAGNIGDTVDFVQSTGALVARTPSANSGVGTLAITSDVATVALWPGSLPALDVGTVLQTAAGPATILSLGTGTGGNGTYNISAVANQAATAGFNYSTAPASGNTNIPHSQLTRYNTTDTADGLVVLRMTN